MMSGKEMSKSASMGTATIGPAAWRNNTLNEIKQSSTFVKKSDHSCHQGRSNDPLPNLREVLSELSNDEAHRYFRQTRAVVCLLRESLIDTNEEIKALTRNKEALEKALEHIRKDVQLNLDCVTVRSTRPQREKPTDGADGMLKAERMQLLNMKKMLESQLQLVQQQLQTLDGCRRRLSNVVQERSRVVDLVCAANSQSASMTRPSMKNSLRNYSASPCPDHTAPQIDPLGPYTPETDSALQEAKDARLRSSMLRKQAQNIINNVQNIQKDMHNTVNHGMTSKAAETADLKQQLDIASGENRHALNRAQRYFDQTERSWMYSKGPMMLEELTCREKLERPIIKVFQRHPGNNMSEAQHIVRSGDGLLQALHSTSNNIGTMRMARLHLQDDIRDKQSALSIDSSVLRMRRRRADHRWVMGQHVY